MKLYVAMDCCRVTNCDVLQSVTCICHPSVVDEMPYFGTDQAQQNHRHNVPAPERRPCCGRERSSNENGYDATGQAEMQHSSDDHEGREKPNNAIHHFFHLLSKGRAFLVKTSKTYDRLFLKKVNRGKCVDYFLRRAKRFFASGASFIICFA